MQFALSTAPQNCTWSDLLEVWQVADAAPQLHSAWLFDHFYPIFSDPTGPCLEGWSTLAALAAVTRRIRLGVLVTGNIHRHPAVLANMAATVDVVSGGRLELGLGAGWNAQECGAYGIPLFTVRERLERMDEAAAILTGLLRDETTTYDGKHSSSSRHASLSGPLRAMPTTGTTAASTWPSSGISAVSSPSTALR